MPVERPHRAVARARVHEIHALEQRTVRQMRCARVGHARPRERDRSQLWQFCQHREPAVGDATAAQIEMLQSAQAREVAQSVVGDLRRPVEVERCEMVETGDAFEQLVGHLPRRVEAWRLPLAEQPECDAPIARVNDLVLLSLGVGRRTR